MKEADRRFDHFDVQVGFTKLIMIKNVGYGIASRCERKTFHNIPLGNFKCPVNMKTKKQTYEQKT